MTKKKNILYIFPDQLGYRWLGCSGNSLVKSPYIDRFAEESFHFSAAYSNSPVCTPYRGLLLTGKYPTQTGVTQNGHQIPEGVSTIADHLNEASYHTEYIGKWHLSGAPQCNRWIPPDRRGGFQKFIGWESHHVDHMQGLVWDRPDRPIILKGHETDGLTNIVLDRLRGLDEKQTEQPFCMFISYQAPHPPCTPLSPYQDHYDPVDLCSEPNTDRSAQFKNKFWNADYDTQEFRRRYYSEITQLDAAFGRILAYLDESGLADNTIVIFTSDHGEMNGCHGLFGKGVMYEESIRIPLLIRIPGQSGHQIKTPVSTIDLFPTLIDLAGITLDHPTEGNSLTHLLSGEKSDRLYAPIFFEYGDWLGLMKDEFKLTIKRDSGMSFALFHRQNDPYELENLVQSEAHRNIRNQLQQVLADWQANIQTKQ